MSGDQVQRRWTAVGGQSWPLLEGERWWNVFQLNVTLCVEGKVQRTAKRTELITVVMDLKDVTLRACSVEFI